MSRIPVRCSCGWRWEMEPELAGEQIRCPQCGALVFVPMDHAMPAAAAIATLPRQAAEPQRLRLGPLIDRARLGLRGYVFAPRVEFFWAGTFWLFTANRPPSLLVLVNYVALVLCVWSGVLWLREKWAPAARLPRWSTAIVVALSVVVWGRYDWYVERTVEENNFRKTTVVRSYRRWPMTGRPYHVWQMWIATDGGGSGSLEGYYSPSGKEHGRWRWSSRGGGEYHSGEWWFWYGDLISEGEWHLRNK